MNRFKFIYAGLSLLLFACTKKDFTLFELQSTSKTGIEFNNAITETEYFNILVWEQIYNGGGVGLGDMNNDGLLDIFFSGNLVSNRLYLNQGGFRFRDVTDESGLMTQNRWCTGVALVDLNSDGLWDIYIGASFYDSDDKRSNLLYINQGMNNEGVPRFKEEAAKYGVGDTGHTATALFFDYDRDNDLDLYILRNQFDILSADRYRVKLNGGLSKSNDKLYRNNGNNSFTDITREAGILYEGYGMGVNASDINNDGWVDLYVTNDYLTNDVLYINNGDGTFSNQTARYLKHQSHFARGNDIADINNDGLQDILEVDMLPADNQGQKRMIRESKFSDYVNNDKFGYEYQYQRNMLYLNNGAGQNGEHVFSEIGFYAGVYASGWSWAPLIADFDNDCNMDIFISNGFPKNIADMDYGMQSLHYSEAWNKKELLSTIPELHTNNFYFRNQGNLKFKEASAGSGFNTPSFSYSSAYGDLDNDGDLDLVVSNINATAFLYKNNSDQSDSLYLHHYFRIQLKGPDGNLSGIGSKIKIYYGKGRIQFREFNPYRGYLGTVEPFVHFGLGAYSRVDSIEITWPDGRFELIRDLPCDQVFTADYKNAGKAARNTPSPADQKLFINSNLLNSSEFKHFEHVFADYNIQPLLPHQFSQSGPSLAAGDINGDGTVDIFIGGSLEIPGTFLIQKNGKFIRKDFASEKDKDQEDLGALLFDADHDNDLDLYIVSGGYEQDLIPEAYLDRLYLNNGKGEFTKMTSALPDMLASGSCVKAADFDKDGDLDLFIGGRVWPGRYPKAVSSYLLENRSHGDSIVFVDITGLTAPSLKNIGLVTDALWTDFDNDGWYDLILAGEWMPLTFLKNVNGKLENITASTGLGGMKGWWNSLCGADFDHDGDIDYVAGNHGLNSFYKASEKEPVTVYHGDIKPDKKYTFLITEYLPDSLGVKRPYPVHSLLDLVKQEKSIADRIHKFSQYSNYTIDDILTEEEKKNIHTNQATWLQSTYIKNLGNGKFEATPLPAEAQLAPVFGMLASDFDDDGNSDILLIGNDYGISVFWGRIDALNGLMLKGDGLGNFTPRQYNQTGFFVPGDGKSLVEVPLPGNERLIIAAQNQDSLKVFSMYRKNKFVYLRHDDARAEVTTVDGRTQLYEFYYGNSYLSQSARIFDIPKNARQVKIFNFRGVSREL